MKLLNEAMGRLLGYLRMHVKEMRRLNDPTGEIEGGQEPGADGTKCVPNTSEAEEDEAEADAG